MSAQPEEQDPGYGYMTAGWNVLPLPPEAKYPPPEGYTGGSPDDLSAADYAALREEPRYRGGNIGIRLPDGVLGLDVDHYAGKSGGDTLKALEADLGPLPPTWVSTARGVGASGIRLFRVPEGHLWEGSPGPGIDTIQRAHRYLVVSPSVNPKTGTRYRWIDPAGISGTHIPAVSDIPELPEAWVERLRRDGSPDSGSPRMCSEGALRDWLAANDGPPCPRTNSLVVKPMGANAHDTMKAAAVNFARLAAEGHSGLAGAAEELRRQFVAAATAPSRGAGKAVRTPDEAGDEFARMLRWAIGLVATETHRDGHALECDGVLPDIWEERPSLTYIRDKARARRVSPWSLLGTVLARVAAEVEPTVQLPAIVGDRASMNLFVGLVGPSGVGKSVSLKVAGGVRGWDPDVRKHGLGSGEGLLKMWCSPVRQPGPPPTYQVVQHHTRALVFTDEVDTLAALGQRSGATLLGLLKSAWNGEALQQQYSDPAKRNEVGEHAYRLSFVVGVQPDKAGAILDDDGGGLPQRFVWFDCLDPEAPAARPPDPGEWYWPKPPTDGPLVCEVAVDPSIVAEIDAARLEVVQTGRASVEMLEGHRALLRLRVAALLGIMEGRLTVTPEDWALSSWIMLHSDAQVAVMRAHHADKAERAKKARREDRATEAVLVDSSLHGTAVARVRDRIALVVKRSGGSTTLRDAKKAVSGKARGLVDEAVAHEMFVVREELSEAGRAKHVITLSE